MKQKLYDMLMSEYFWYIFLVVIVLAIVGITMANAECLPSAAAVRAEHGTSAWSTWRNVSGRRCYMEGKGHENSVRNGDTLRHSANVFRAGVYGFVFPSSPALIPLPREREGYPQIPPELGRRLADLLLPEADFSARFGAAYPD